MKRLQVLADVAVTVVAVVIVAFLGWTVFAPAPNAPVSLSRANIEEHLIGTQLDGEKLGFAISDRPTALLMVLASNCSFCQESMPFYRRLLAHERDRIQVVVAAPVQDSGISDYLASEHVTPDAVVFTEPGDLPVSATPTVRVVDSDGVTTHAWIGRLSPEREADVLHVLFGA